MAEKISLELAIETGKSARNLGQLEEAAENLKDLLKKTDFGTKEFNELNQALKDVNREIKNTELNMEALDNEQVASELGSVAGAVGDVTAAFILLGGDEDSAMAETARRIETALGVTMAFKGTIEGVISFQKLWNNTLKKTAVVQKVIALGTKAYAAAQGVLNFVVGAGSKALKLFRLALLATGIGAIVVGIGMLIASFGKVKEVIMDIIDNVLAPFRMALQAVGLMESDEETAQQKRAAARRKRAEEEKRLREKRIAQIEADIKREQAVHDQRTAMIDQDIALLKSQGKSTTELMRQKLKAEEDFTRGQMVLTQERTALRTIELENEIKIFEKSIEMFGDNFGAGKKIIELKAEIENQTNQQAQAETNFRGALVQTEIFENELANERRARRKKEANEKQKARDKEIAAEKKKAEELQKIELKRLQNIQKLEDDFRSELEAETDKFNEQFLTAQQIEEQAVQDKYFRLIAMAQEYGESITTLEANREAALAEIRKNFSDEQLANEQEVNQARIESEQALQDAKLGAAKGLIAGLQQVAGDNEKIANALFIADKALAIGEIIVNLQREIAGIAATNAALGPAGIPITAAQTIAAKIRAATGIATIAASSIAKFKNGGSVGGAGGGISGAVPGGGSAPTLQPVTNTSTLVPQDPQQVFVTETDITNTQNKVAVIEDQATID